MPITPTLLQLATATPVAPPPDAGAITAPRANSGGERRDDPQWTRSLLQRPFELDLD